MDGEVEVIFEEFLIKSIGVQVSLYQFCIGNFVAYFETLSSSFPIVQELDPLITSNDAFIDLVWKEVCIFLIMEAVWIYLRADIGH